MRHTLVILLCSALVVGCGGSGSSGHDRQPVANIFTQLLGAMVFGMFGGSGIQEAPETGMVQIRDYVSGASKKLIIDAHGTVGSFDIVVANEIGEILHSQIDVPADNGVIEVPMSDLHDNEFWITTIHYYDYVGGLEVSLEGYRHNGMNNDEGGAQ